jgi:hypothetical protein
MPTHTLLAKSFASSPPFRGSALSAYGSYSYASSSTSNSGDSDGGVCVRDLNDGKYIATAVTLATFIGENQLAIATYLEDDAVIPVSAVINSVKFRANIFGVASDGVPFTPTVRASVSFFGDDTTGSGIEAVVIGGGATGVYNVIESVELTQNPVTMMAWARGDLFANGDVSGNGHGGIFVVIGVDFPVTVNGDYRVDYIGVVVTYSAGTWCFNPTSNRYVYAPECPGPPFISGVNAPTIAITGIEPRATSSPASSPLMRSALRVRSIPRAAITPTRSASRAMAGYLLRPLAWIASPMFGGEGNPPSNLFVLNQQLMAGQSFNGDGDGGVCTQQVNDAKDITFNDASFPSFDSMWMMFDSTGFPVIPITRVKFRVRAKGVNFIIDNSAQLGTGGVQISISPPIADPGGGANIPLTVGTLGPTYSVLETAWMTVNPVTGNAWQYAELFHNPNDLTSGSFQGWMFDFYCSAPGGTFGVDAFRLIINEDVPEGTGQWCFNPTSNHYVFAAECPGPPWISGVAPPTITVTGVSPQSG